MDISVILSKMGKQLETQKHYNNMNQIEIGDIVRFQYLGKPESEGKALIVDRIMDNIFETKIIEHVKFAKNSTIRLLRSELLEKV